MHYSPSPTALFRYRIISAIEARIAAGYRSADAVRLVADQEHLMPKGLLKQFTPRTLYRWRSAYSRSGLQGLEPARRAPMLGSKVIDEQVLKFLIDERLQDPRASIPELIRRARAQGKLREQEKLDRRAVWRAFKRLGMDTLRRARPRSADVRRFEYKERMQMVMVDGCHFRAGPNRAKRVAIYFLDDSTRYGLEVIVGASEHTEHFVRGLEALVRRFGLMDVLYSDNGPAFVSDDASRILANLGIAHITGTPKYPQGRGKIERFNRTARARVLNGLVANHVNPSLAALTLRLRHDLFEVYNRLPHSSLKGQSPAQRWSASERKLVLPRDEQWLSDCFVLTETRRVRLDNVIQFGGKAYEVPAGYAREKIVVYRRLLEANRILIRHRGKWLRLFEVNPQFNSTQKRVDSAQEPLAPEGPARRTASMIDFEQRYGSILEPDGGFCAQTDTEEEIPW